MTGEEGEIGSEKGEDCNGDEANEVRYFRVKTKTFAGHLDEGVCVLKETHLEGQREIPLSMKQASWVVDVLGKKTGILELRTG